MVDVVRNIEISQNIALSQNETLKYLYMDLQYIERDREELRKINKLISEKEAEMPLIKTDLEPFNLTEEEFIKHLDFDYEELFEKVKEYVSYVTSRDALIKKISKSYKEIDNRIKKYGKSYLSMPEIVREYMSNKLYRHE